MKKTVFWLTTLLLLTASSTIAQDVRYNFADYVHFDKFKTYKWVEIKDAPKLDEQKDKQIKDALDAQLAKKKLTKTDSDAADLYIVYQVGAGAGKPLTSYNPDWGFGPGWFKKGFYGGAYGNSMLAPSTISAGQLAVDMYDPKNHYLVWRGVVSKTFDPTVPPEKQEKRLYKSVAKLLEKYPPPLLP